MNTNENARKSKRRALINYSRHSRQYFKYTREKQEENETKYYHKKEN